MRTRRIPSMYRTPGRLLRWNRRYRAHKGEQVPSNVTRKSCADAIGYLHDSIDKGRLNPRSLVVRDWDRIKPKQQVWA